MIRALICILAVGLSACNKPESSQSPSSSTMASPAQCMKDTDCKGDRICEKGTCSTPIATPLVKESATTESSIPAKAEQKKDAADPKQLKQQNKVSRCDAIAEAKELLTYGEVRAALKKSDDLAPSPPDQFSPDTVLGDGASCNESQCEMEWWTYRYGLLAITIAVNPAKEQKDWRVISIESRDNEC